MFNLVEKRRWYFILSAMIIIPGLIIMGYSWATVGAPFRLSIDFTGGSIYNLPFVGREVSEDEIREVFAQYGDENAIIQSLSQNEVHWLITNPSTDETNTEAVTATMEDLFSSSGLGGEFSVSFTEGLGYLFNFTNTGITSDDVETAFADVLGDGATLEETVVSAWSTRGTNFRDSDEQSQLLADLEALAPVDSGRRSLEDVSPTIGAEVTRASIFAILLGAAVITGFIVIAFRQIPNAFRFGVCAILAMVHDIFIMMGVMSLMGILLGWEVDALFLTALLTVVGFSVQDSIVVFDRIRENIPIRLGEPYETIVNRSPLGNDSPFTGDSVKCFLYHDCIVALRWRNSPALYLHSVYRITFRKLFIPVYSRSIACILGKRRNPVC